MKRLRVAVTVLFCSILLVASSAYAAKTRLAIADVVVTGATNKDELKTVISSLLASRLAGDKFSIAENAAESDLQLTTSYVVIGKVASIDAAVRDANGVIIYRTYVQGEQDELIPAVGKLAQQLIQGVDVKAVTPAEPAAVKPIVVNPQPVPLPVSAPLPAAASASSEIIKAVNQPQIAAINAVTRLNGVMISFAPARTTSGGGREFYVAGKSSLRLYQYGAEVKMLHEVTFDPKYYVLGVDSADLDADGTPEAYVTMMNGESLESQVWVAGEKGLVKVAEQLPYYFRALALEGGARKLYAQQIGQEGIDFYGSVSEVQKKNGKYVLVNPLKLPRHGMIYNFNRFVDAAGKKFTVMIDPDSYLRVYDASDELLWTSGDRYGGSEIYFKRDEQRLQPISMDRFRWVYLEQRLIVTDKGEILVPRNTGLFALGNNRSFTKSSVHAYKWNGAALDETWRTKESQNYLADFHYDDKAGDLVQLEVVKKEGLFEKGASTITHKKIE